MIINNEQRGARGDGEGGATLLDRERALRRSSGLKKSELVLSLKIFLQSLACTRYTRNIDDTQTTKLTRSHVDATIPSYGSLNEVPRRPSLSLRRFFRPRVLFGLYNSLVMSRSNCLPPSSPESTLHRLHLHGLSHSLVLPFCLPLPTVRRTL